MGPVGGASEAGPVAPGGSVTGPEGEGNQAAADYARQFLGRDSYTLKGVMDHFTAAGGKTNNCADFVSSALESTGGLKGHYVGVKALEQALIEQGLRKAMATKTEKPFKLRDRSVGGNGLTPEFQNASWEQLRDAIEEGRGG